MTSHVITKSSQQVAKCSQGYEEFECECEGRAHPITGRLSPQRRIRMSADETSDVFSGTDSLFLVAASRSLFAVFKRIEDEFKFRAQLDVASFDCVLLFSAATCLFFIFFYSYLQGDLENLTQIH